MEATRELIKRFLENSCTPEKAAQVHQYLLHHKEELDKWLPDEECGNLWIRTYYCPPIKATAGLPPLKALRKKTSRLHTAAPGPP